MDRQTQQTRAMWYLLCLSSCLLSPGGLVVAPPSVSTEEEQQTEQLSERDGQCGDIGQGSGPQSFSGALNFLIVKEMAGFDGCQGPTAGVEFCGECDQLKNSCQAETGNAGIYQIIHLGAVHGKQQAHQNQRHGQPGANVGNGNDGGTNLNGYILHSMLHRVPGLVAGYANGGCGGIAEYVVRQAPMVARTGAS